MLQSKVFELRRDVSCCERRRVRYGLLPKTTVAVAFQPRLHHKRLPDNETETFLMVVQWPVRARVWTARIGDSWTRHTDLNTIEPHQMVHVWLFMYYVSYVESWSRDDTLGPSENEHHRLLICFNSAFQLFSTWVAPCPADKLQGCYRERLFHFSWTIYWPVRFSNPTRYRKLDPHLQLLEHTSTCSLVHGQCSTCTLLYPVSLLSGCWDR